MISPLGEPVAELMRRLPGGLWFHSHIDGIEVGDYKTVDEAVKDLADQHRALIGADDDDVTIRAREARAIITGTVHNLQINQNALGIQLTGDTRERIEEAVDGADPSTLKRVLKEWIPQSFLGAGVGILLSMLGVK